MRIGNMRERVTLERETRTPNGQGGWTRGWQAVATVFAEIEGQSGNEAMNASVERSVNRWRVTIREIGATAKDRIVWHEMDDMKLDIVSAMPDRKNRGYQLLLCESGTTP
ncbi:MAG: phage head closure protein [Parasphingorhabdus sp.]|uniref:phage head closure protein n=1 Tax=Parasphingorhabdus sp. TaxID=2709688 RepID=UPI003297D2D9